MMIEDLVVLVIDSVAGSGNPAAMIGSHDCRRCSQSVIISIVQFEKENAAAL